MALIFMDGFDKGDLSKKWDYVSSSATPSATTRFGEGMSMYVDDDYSNYCGVMKRFSAVSEIVIGCAMRRYSDTGRPTVMLLSDNAITKSIHVCIENLSGQIVVRRGGSNGTILATGSTTVGQTWVYLEIKATISDTTGSVEIRLNGSKTPEIKLTGIDTKTGTNDTIDAALFGRDAVTSYSQNGYIDDVYILDTTGATNNDFLGDSRIRTLSPVSNGTHSQWIGSDGDQVDNYALVDETPYSSTDYTASSIVGSRDTYGLENLSPDVSSVLAIQNNVVIRKDNAGEAYIKTAMLINSNLHYGSVEAPFTELRTFSTVYDSNPETSSLWTISDVDNIEAGIENTEIV